MIADAARATELAPSNPIARITSVVFGARSGMAPAARLAARAGAAVLRLGAYALGRLVHAIVRNEDPVCAGIQAAPLRRRDPVSDAGTRRDNGEHGRNRAADPAHLRAPHPLGGARPFGHDRRHPAHLSGRLGELSFVLGGDGARDPHFRPRRDFGRPAHWPRRVDRRAGGTSPRNCRLRSDRNPVRTSSEKSCGCSQAAK